MSGCMTPRSGDVTLRSGGSVLRSVGSVLMSGGPVLRSAGVAPRSGGVSQMSEWVAWRYGPRVQMSGPEIRPLSGHCRQGLDGGDWQAVVDRVCPAIARETG